jgi:hypothetical protein
MISHEFDFIFIHIPKCAGTSVENFFGHSPPEAGRGAQDHRPMRLLQTPIPWRQALRGGENRLCLARRVYHRCRSHPNPRNKRTVDARQYARYFKFAIIRDPWSRTYSWYRNVVRDPLHRRKYRVEPTIGFGDFLERFGGRGMLAPIDFWLKEFDGGVRMDRLIRFEDLAAEFPRLCADLGAAPTELPRRNTAEGAVDLAAVYDAALRDRVAAIYADEIRTYRFDFPADA